MLRRGEGVEVDTVVLRPGEGAVDRVVLRPGEGVEVDTVVLRPGEGVEVDTVVLRPSVSSEPLMKWTLSSTADTEASSRQHHKYCIAVETAFLSCQNIHNHWIVDCIYNIWC